MLDKTEGPVIIPQHMRDVVRDHAQMAQHIRAIRRDHTALAQKMQELKERFGLRIAARAARMLALGKGIFFYAMEHREELLLNGKKVYDLPRGGSIEWEHTQPALEVDDEEAAVALLERLNLRDCINYQPTVDKTALKAKLKERPELIKKLKGMRLASKEMFRIRFPGLDERVECPVNEPEQIDLAQPRKKKAATPAR